MPTTVRPVSDEQIPRSSILWKEGEYCICCEIACNTDKSICKCEWTNREILTTVWVKKSIWKFSQPHKGKASTSMFRGIISKRLNSILIWAETKADDGGQPLTVTFSASRQYLPSVGTEHYAEWVVFYFWWLLLSSRHRFPVPTNQLGFLFSVCI